jgi:cytochrome c
MSVLKKLSYLLAAGMAAATLSGAVLAADDMSTEAIAERIAPVGQVYTAKDLEGIATAAAACGSLLRPRDGETVFKGACFACHDTGAAGAPSEVTRPPGSHASPRGSTPAQTRHRRLHRQGWHDATTGNLRHLQ